MFFLLLLSLLLQLSSLYRFRGKHTSSFVLLLDLPLVCSPLPLRRCFSVAPPPPPFRAFLCPFCFLQFTPHTASFSSFLVHVITSDVPILHYTLLRCCPVSLLVVCTRHTCAPSVSICSVVFSTVPPSSASIPCGEAPLPIAPLRHGCLPLFAVASVARPSCPLPPPPTCSVVVVRSIRY